jgi:hypothetical protein
VEDKIAAVALNGSLLLLSFLLFRKASPLRSILMVSSHPFLYGVSQGRLIILKEGSGLTVAPAALRPQYIATIRSSA